MNKRAVEQTKLAAIVGIWLAVLVSVCCFLSGGRDRWLSPVIFAPTVLSAEGRFDYFLSLSHACRRKENIPGAAFFGQQAFRYAASVKPSRLVSAVYDLEDLGRSDDMVYALTHLSSKPDREWDARYMNACRVNSLGSALIGVHRYREAISVLQSEVPGLHCENAMSASNEFTQHLAYACLGDYEASKASLIRSKTLYGCYCSSRGNDTFLNLLESVIWLKCDDSLLAKSLCDDHIRYWSQPEYSAEGDSIMFLEVVAKVMSNKGFDAESRRLTLCANQQRNRFKCAPPTLQK